MAKKLLEPEIKPDESSGSDDSDDSESVSGSESDPETPPPKSANLTPQNLPPAASASASSVSESGSGSDSGSESDSAESDPKPHEEPQKPKPNPTASMKGSAVGVKRGGGKVVETPESKKVKKIEPLAKKDGKLEGGVGEESGKKLFQRVFSEDDEIVLLKAMLEFTEERKSDPFGNMDEFSEFVKKVLHLDVTKAQLLNKMKRLRSKYNGHASKEKDGQDLKIHKQHEREMYELSKRIWGGSDVENSNGEGGVESAKVNGSVVKKNVKKNVVVPTVSPNAEDTATVAVIPGSDDNKLRSRVTDDVGGSFMYSALEDRIMREEIKNIDTQMQRELVKKLSEIEEAELQLCARRCEYVALKARLMIAAKKN